LLSKDSVYSYQIAYF